MSNYIFLDIDGVMNNYNDWIEKVDKGLEKFKNHRMFCDYSWDLLAELCHKTGAKVVLTSSWRYGLKIQDAWVVPELMMVDTLTHKLLNYFSDNKIELIGFTEKTGASRGKQINNYVEEYLTKDDHFIVIDDEDFDIKKYVSKEQFIKTTFKTGFQEEHYNKAYNYFKKKFKEDNRKAAKEYFIKGDKDKDEVGHKCN